MQRLLIVSNRLPINVTTGCEERQWNFKLSSGGLVSALAGFQKTMNFIWIGWPGIGCVNVFVLNVRNRCEFVTARRIFQHFIKELLFATCIY